MSALRTGRQEIHDKVKGIKLSSLITAISVNPSLATGIGIGEAVNDPHLVSLKERIPENI